jgi:hypothetical protein
MKRTDVTYGRLDRILRSLGFSCRLITQEPPPARLYEHKETGAIMAIPPLPMTEVVRDDHILIARTTLKLYGIADPDIFDAKLQKTG